MFRFKLRSQPIQSLWLCGLLFFLSWGLISCSDRLQASEPLSEPIPQVVITGKLAEVTPPPVIQELRQVLEQYSPQVSIVSPKTDQMFEETTISVKLQVRDLPLFNNAEFQMGPHIHLIVDNEPYQAVYNVDKPIILENLTPGTHTIRVFASRPWHESFKNEGAYAQSTFHILTKTGENAPNPSLPLLTYSRPKRDYGAQPIMLDFYLTNAPLHVVARDNNEDEIVDWRIRVTVNGESFLLDTWQPIYLTGFEEGKNWVQLEFIDEKGNLVDNAFNNTVRLITYTPNGQDTLSKMVRGELSAQAVRSIVDPNYIATPISPTPELSPVEETATEPEEPITEDSLTEIEPSEPVTEEIVPEGSLTQEPETQPEEPVKVTEQPPVSEEPLTQEQQADEVKPEVIPISSTVEKETPLPEKSTVLDSSVVNSTEIIQPTLENPPSQPSSIPQKNQGLEKLKDSFKQINVTQITQYWDNLKNKFFP